MPKEKMSEAAKAEREARKNTPEFMRERLAKLKADETRMLVELAVTEHPELKDVIGTVGGFVKEVSKIDEAVKAAGSAGVKNQKERIEKMVAHYKGKIEELEKQLLDVNESTVIANLTEQRRRTMENLKRAVDAGTPQITAAGLNLADVLPMLADVEAELASIVLPADPVA